MPSDKDPEVEAAPDDTPVDPYNNAGPYEGLESLVSKCSRGTADLLALNLQAISDYLYRPR